MVRYKVWLTLFLICYGHFGCAWKNGGKGKEASNTCTHGGILNGVFLHGGLKSRNDTIFTNIPDMQACIQKCCKVDQCDLAMKIGSVCHAVKCKDEDSCQITHAKKSSTLKAQISFITKGEELKKELKLPISSKEEAKSMLASSQAHLAKNAEHIQNNKQILQPDAEADSNLMSSNTNDQKISLDEKESSSGSGSGIKLDLEEGLGEPEDESDSGFDLSESGFHESGSGFHETESGFHESRQSKPKSSRLDSRVKNPLEPQLRSSKALSKTNESAESVLKSIGADFGFDKSLESGLKSSKINNGSKSSMKSGSKSIKIDFEDDSDGSGISSDEITDYSGSKPESSGDASSGDSSGSGDSFDLNSLQATSQAESNTALKPSAGRSDIPTPTHKKVVHDSPVTLNSVSNEADKGFFAISEKGNDNAGDDYDDKKDNNNDNDFTSGSGEPIHLSLFSDMKPKEQKKQKGIKTEVKVPSTNSHIKASRVKTAAKENRPSSRPTKLHVLTKPSTTIPILEGLKISQKIDDLRSLSKNLNADNKAKEMDKVVSSRISKEKTSLNTQHSSMKSKNNKNASSLLKMKKNASPSPKKIKNVASSSSSSQKTKNASSLQKTKNTSSSSSKKKKDASSKKSKKIASKNHLPESGDKTLKMVPSTTTKGRVLEDLGSQGETFVPPLSLAMQNKFQETGQSLHDSNQNSVQDFQPIARGSIIEKPVVNTGIHKSLESSRKPEHSDFEESYFNQRQRVHAKPVTELQMQLSNLFAKDSKHVGKSRNDLQENQAAKKRKLFEKIRRIQRERERERHYSRAMYTQRKDDGYPLSILLMKEAGGKPLKYYIHQFSDWHGWKRDELLKPPEQEQKCKKGVTIRGATLKGGILAGDFQTVGIVSNQHSCVQSCCNNKRCDVALMLGKECFNVKCYTESLCGLAPATTLFDEVTPVITYVRGHINKRSIDIDDFDENNIINKMREEDERLVKRLQNVLDQ